MEDKMRPKLQHLIGSVLKTRILQTPFRQP
jgi:hypothetical protein